jgi:mono/diheme cytochrome c family protein
MLPFRGIATVACAMGLFGCKPPEPIALHEPNYLYTHVLSTTNEIELEQPLSDASELLTEWFGTPDEPKIPDALAEEDYEELLSLPLLMMAAGPAPKSKEPGETGLYRQLCSSCHGDSGQGRGPVAASQNPYPRDFRHGIFKYKSTARNKKPTKADLAKSLRQGLAGTQMPVFNKLSDQQIDALVDYVVYLSIRGEFERKLMYYAVNELDVEKERLYTASLKQSSGEDDMKNYSSQVDSATELLTGIANAWVGSQNRSEKFALPSFPIFGSENAENASLLKDSIEKGRVLFASEESACAKCHGVTAMGDGAQLPDYDDWTKEWTTKISIKPTATEKLLPFMARGGMKPQALKPRNIVEGKFRGGRDPMDLARRIRHGIVGSPMPAASIASSPEEKGLREEDIWHLVNFVLSISDVPAPKIEESNEPQQASKSKVGG